MATREDHCSFPRFDLVSVRYRSHGSIRVVWLIARYKICRPCRNFWPIRQPGWSHVIDSAKGCDLLQVLLFFFMQDFSLLELIVSEIYLTLFNSIICLICRNQNKER